MIERGLLALLIVVGLALAYWGVSQVILIRRARRGLGLDAYLPGTPAILYFTAPGCVPCETLQRPALAELQVIMGRPIRVIEVDASVRTDLADGWGVLTVPTTFIIDARGRPRRVNHGVATVTRLVKQLEAIGELPARGSSRQTAAEAAE